MTMAAVPSGKSTGLGSCRNRDIEDLSGRGADCDASRRHGYLSTVNRSGFLVGIPFWPPLTAKRLIPMRRRAMDSAINLYSRQFDRTGATPRTIVGDLASSKAGHFCLSNFALWRRSPTALRRTKPPFSPRWSCPGLTARARGKSNARCTAAERSISFRPG